MSYFNVAKQFAKTLNDISLGVTVVQENDDFEPTTNGQWCEMTMLAHDYDSMAKSGAGDLQSGICQVSIFDAAVGTMQGNLYALADALAAEFTHGKEYNDFTDAVYIDRLTRNTGRVEGGFYQCDVSIYWTSYTDR